MHRRPASRHTPTGLLPLLCALLACAHGASQTPAAQASSQTKPTKPVIPAGCEAMVSGEYRHEDDPSYRYKAQDDGTELILRPYRLSEDGTNDDMSSKAKEMVLELRRTPEGFVGVFRMTEVTGDADGGVRCQALFSTKVTACAPTKLTLQVEQEYAMDQACKRVDTGGVDIAEHVLLKMIPATDGG